ncbi:MAG: RNA polymerase sigma factor [Anaerolineales bacterium]
MQTDLLDQCKRGDPAALERLVKTYQADVYRLTLSILDDPNEASDALQETFLAALRALENFRGESTLKTWLYSIAINLCRSRLARRRTRARLQHILEILQPTALPPEEKAIQNERETDLRQFINTMDEKHRLPLILRYDQNLPIGEIAALLRLPVGTVHSRLNSARKRLRAALEEKNS